MARQSRAAYLTAARDLEALATIASAENPDGSEFALPVEGATGGGGSAATEYTEGATDATITGVAALWEDTSDTLRSVSISKPLPVNPVVTGSNDLANNQVSISTTAVVSPAASTQRSVTIRNHDASVSAYVGKTGVTTSTGMLLKAGEALRINTKLAVHAVAASGTVVISYLAEVD